MANYPDPVQDDKQSPRQPVGVDPPAYDANEDGSKSQQELLVEQQWRDVVNQDVNTQHPLSINRDEKPPVTTDPYTV